MNYSWPTSVGSSGKKRKQEREDFMKSLVGEKGEHFWENPRQMDKRSITSG